MFVCRYVFTKQYTYFLTCLQAFVFIKQILSNTYIFGIPKI